MDLGFNGKVAVITGGVGGMGEECARILAAEGAKVVIADILDEAGEELAKELGEAVYIHVDVTKLQDISEMVDHALEAFDTIDILINTAGVGGRPVKSVAEVEKWDYLFAVHVRGTAACIKEVTERVMIPKGYGRIVNIGSLANHSGLGGMSGYAAAKAAIRQLTLGGARQLGRHGINMNCVSPGSVHTPMTETSYANPEFVERIKKDVVFGYVGGAKEIAYPIVFLCSDLMKWAVGADLNVSAGQVIY